MLKGLALLYELNSRPARRGDSRRFRPEQEEKRREPFRREERRRGRRDEAVKRRNAG